MDTVCTEQSHTHVRHDTTYRQIFNGQDVMMACRRQAYDALNHHPNQASAAEALVQARIEECKYLGQTDSTFVEHRQLMLVISLAIIANDDPYSETVKAEVLCAKDWARFGNFLHGMIFEMTSGLFRKGIKKLPSATLKRINTFFNRNLISKDGKTSFTSLTKLSDFTQKQLLAQVDGWFTRKIANHAMQKFFPESPIS